MKQEHKYKDQIEMGVDNKVSIELCLKTNNHYNWQKLSDWILSHLKVADSLFKKICFFEVFDYGKQVFDLLSFCKFFLSYFHK